MAIQLIPNQPVIFEDTTDICKCTSALNYKQLVAVGDITQFQFNFDLCLDAENILVNPNFNDNTGWVFPEGGSEYDPLPNEWTIADNKVCRTPYNGVESCFYQVITAPAQGMYYLNVNVISTSDLFTVTISNATIDIAFINITSAGISNLRYYWDGNGDDMTITICAVDSVCIDGIELFNMTENKIFPIVRVVDAVTGLTVKQWDGSDPTIVLNEGIEFWVFNYVGNSVTVNIDWSREGIPVGCYYICLIDPCNTVNNQNLSNIVADPSFDDVPANSWTIITSVNTFVNITGGKAQYTSTNTSGTAEITNDNLAVNGLCYDTTLIITDTPVDARARIVIGSVAGAWHSTAGTFTEGITSGGQTITIEVETTNSSAASSINISSVVIKVADECLECTYQSNEFKYDYFDDCTHLVSGCCNENGMGFVFGASLFSPRIRLISKYVKATYKAERVIFEDSAGKKTVPYFRRRKARAFIVDTAPEYVHDFLSTLMGYDHLYISGIEYVVLDDEYQPVYSSADDEMASVTINIEEKIQLVENKNCGADDLGCGLDAQMYISDPSGQFTIATPGGICLGL